MRSIGTITEPERADQLSWVLLAQGIRVDLDQGDEGVRVWVHDDAAVPTAREQMAAFLQSPDDPRYTEVIAAGKAKHANVRADDARWRRRIQLARASAHGVDGRGWLTMILLGASLVVAARSQLGADWTGYSALLLTTFPPSAGLPEVMHGQVWRLVTPIVIHYGVMHLLFNMYMWWTWAQRIETFRGLAFFAPFVLVTAVITNLGEHVWGLLTAPDIPRAVGGMSGVLYGLFGYAWRRQQIDPHAREIVSQDTVQWMLIWLVLCMTGVMGSVANAAHTLGLLTGMAWAHLDLAWFHWQKRR